MKRCTPSGRSSRRKRSPIQPASKPVCSASCLLVARFNSPLEHLKGARRIDRVEVLPLEVLDHFAEVGVAFAEADRHVLKARCLSGPVATFTSDEFKSPRSPLGSHDMGLYDAYRFDAGGKTLQLLLVDVRADVGAGINVDLRDPRSPSTSNSYVGKVGRRGSAGPRLLRDGQTMVRSGQRRG